MITPSLDTLTAAVAGDRKATRDLLAGLDPMVRAFCASRIPQRGDHDADDVAQEVLVSIVQMLPRFEVRGLERFISAVLTIARRRIVEAWRRPRRDIPTLMEAVPEAWTEVSPERVVIARVELGQVAEALRSLSPVQRSVTVMRVEGHRTKEISAALGFPASSVRTWHCRALATLRKNIAAVDGGDTP